MLTEEVLLRCKQSGDMSIKEGLPDAWKSSAVIHTAHVGNFASSCRSSLAVAASVVSDPTVCAVTVNAERKTAAIVGRCMMDLGRSCCIGLQSQGFNALSDEGL
jgi:hypothetical protein